MMGDIWSDDPTVERWAKSVIEEMAPKVANSALVCSIVPAKDGEYTAGDVKLWVELGATIYMEKPIVLVAIGNTRIPPKLARIADEVVRLPDGVDPAGADELQAAIKRVLGED